MDTRNDTLTRLLALTSRRVTVLERALAVVVRHARTDEMADELLMLAQERADDEAASALHTLARMARR